MVLLTMVSRICFDAFFQYIIPGIEKLANNARCQIELLQLLRTYIMVTAELQKLRKPFHRAMYTNCE